MTGILQSIAVSAAPYIAYRLVAWLFKGLGLGSITSIGGALSFSATSAGQVVGGQDTGFLSGGELSDNIDSGVERVSEAGRFARRKATDGARWYTGTANFDPLDRLQYNRLRMQYRGGKGRNRAFNEFNDTFGAARQDIEPKYQDFVDKREQVAKAKEAGDVDEYEKLYHEMLVEHEVYSARRDHWSPKLYEAAETLQAFGDDAHRDHKRFVIEDFHNMGVVPTPKPKEPLLVGRKDALETNERFAQSMRKHQESREVPAYAPPAAAPNNNGPGAGPTVGGGRQGTPPPGGNGPASTPPGGNPPGGGSGNGGSGQGAPGSVRPQKPTPEAEQDRLALRMQALQRKTNAELKSVRGEIGVASQRTERILQAILGELQRNTHSTEDAAKQSMEAEQDRRQQEQRAKRGAAGLTYPDPRDDGQSGSSAGTSGRTGRPSPKPRHASSGPAPGTNSAKPQKRAAQVPPPPPANDAPDLDRGNRGSGSVRPPDNPGPFE